jgi:hypothetical protein
MFIRLICTFRSLSDCVAGGAGKGHAASCR